MFIALFILLFSSWGEVKADDSSQSGDRDESDVTRGDCGRWTLFSDWDCEQTEQELVCVFLLGRGKGDELNVWPDGAEYGNDEKVEHPHKSDETASSPSEFSS